MSLLPCSVVRVSAHLGLWAVRGLERMWRPHVLTPCSEGRQAGGLPTCCIGADEECWVRGQTASGWGPFRPYSCPCGGCCLPPAPPVQTLESVGVCCPHPPTGLLGRQLHLSEPLPLLGPPRPPPSPRVGQPREQSPPLEPRPVAGAARARAALRPVSQGQTSLVVADLALGASPGPTRSLLR